MSNLQEQIASVNKASQKVYANHAKREEVIKNIFDFVYSSGLAGVKMDENNPVYRMYVEELLKI